MNWKTIVGIVVLTAGAVFAWPQYSWQMGDVTADTDVVTEGELIAAYAIHAATEVNGVPFEKGSAPKSSINWGSAFTVNIGYVGTRAPDENRAKPEDILPAVAEISAGYRSLLSGVILANNQWADEFSPQGRITIRNLTLGSVYLLQVWCSDPSAYAAERRMILSTDVLPSSVEMRENVTGGNGGAGQWAILKFVALGPEQSVYLSAPVTTATDAIVLTALQLRKIADSAPGTGTFIWSGGYWGVWDKSDLNWGGDGEAMPWIVGSSSQGVSNTAVVMPSSADGYGIELNVLEDLEAAAFVASSGGPVTMIGEGSMSTPLIAAGTNLFVGTRLKAELLAKHDLGTLQLIAAPLAHEIGALDVNKGTVALVPYPNVTDGAMFHLDASARESIVMDANGRVSSWRSIGGVSNVSYDFPPDDPSEFVMPLYNASEFDGKGGIVFGTQGPSKLLASTRMRVKTVLMAVQIREFADFQEVWGVNGTENAFPPAVKLGGSGWGGRDKWFGDSSNPAIFCDETNFWVDASEKLPYPPALLTEPQVVTSLARARGEAVNNKIFALGSVDFRSTYRQSRYLRASIAEVIGFDRDLSRAERAALQTYLTAKWKQNAFSVVVTNLLPASIKVNLAEGASLRIDQAHQNVSTLTGSGKVTGQGRGATLVVDMLQDAKFDGTFEGGLSLYKQGSGVWTLADKVNTLSGPLSVQAGTLKLGTIPAVPTDGLVYCIDASKPSTLVVDADSKVSIWRDVRPSSTMAFRQSDPAAQPTYDPAAFYGLGAVRFGADGQVTSLLNERVTTNQTVVIVAWTENREIPYAGVWGLNNVNYGFRAAGSAYSSGSSRQWAYGAGNSGDFLTDSKGGIFRINGSTTGGLPSVAESIPQVILMNRVTPSNFTATAIGKYWDATPTRQYAGCIGEILVYDRRLTEDEYLQLEQTLMKKWSASSRSLIKVLPGAIDIEVAAGATLDLGDREQTVNSFSGGGAVVNGRLFVSGTITPTGAIEVVNIPLALHIESPDAKVTIAANGDLSTMTITIDKDKLELGTRYPIIICNGDLTGLPVLEGVNTLVWKVRRVGDVIELYSIARTVLELF